MWWSENVGQELIYIIIRKGAMVHERLGFQQSVYVIVYAHWP